jgi:hypothetical protein
MNIYLNMQELQGFSPLRPPAFFHAWPEKEGVQEVKEGDDPVPPAGQPTRRYILLVRPLPGTSCSVTTSVWKGVASALSSCLAVRRVKRSLEGAGWTASRVETAAWRLRLQRSSPPTKKLGVATI